jgi:Cys-tRNA(Pro)/Cys-tRNA(Cys) deacylase
VTPAIIALDAAGIGYDVHPYDHGGSDLGYGLEAAQALGVDPDQVFKTLLVDGGAELAVAIVPVTCRLSLKAVAVALGMKRVDMCEPDRAERSTGYVVGGISPIGQRRRLRTVVDERAARYDRIYVSGGRRGLDLSLAPADLVALLDATVAPITA